MDADMSLPSAPTQQFLTIFLIVRKDLTKTLNWPVGSVIGNAAHAATAVLHKHRTEARVAEYLSDVEGMRKHQRLTHPDTNTHFTVYQVVLETKNEASLAKVEAELTQRGILHHKWIEQPEGIAACIATAPYLRDDVKDCFKKCQLYR
ncbi:peptidyl-tRNA hydrolase domain-containing protein 1 [Chytriomyces hyalinus]|nr:peptidyl-tRNA hydrolase domain-containing protein 1 [Chytriomyces hyalinus]